MKNRLFESTLREADGSIDLAVIEQNLYDLYDHIDTVCRKYHVPTAAREDLLGNVTCVLANGYKLGVAGEPLEEWTWKVNLYPG